MPLHSRLRRFAPIAITTLTLLAPAAWASGHIPPLPLPEQKFPDFPTCLAELQRVSQADAARADAQPQPLPDRPGATRQTLVRSEGVVRVNDNSARYTVHIGTQIRVPDPALSIIRTNYSYEETTLACNGGTLSGARGQGYYLEGHERMQPQTQAQPQTQPQAQPQTQTAPSR